ncbi:EDD domain protein, DegV family [Oceanobacillus limi]|uniref:EDD domain protein, DegV family n=1 Tax=Oceanobacillus limi TaxID=930131 RepID=A0A1I0CG25_9BACI|nr:DegV family protein [Oceanobacillus limi]SET18087.1 EDD domain protein, DegV family [Oceanobacillus limi]
MKKKKIAFVTDSTAYLSNRLRNHPDVYVVPIVVISEGNEYEDGVDLTSDQLYEMIRSNREVPKTSQPNVNQFTALYKQLSEEYESAIAIHVSSQLSGTIRSSEAGKQEAKFEVEVIDSNSLSFAITTLMEKGLELAEQGMEVQQIRVELQRDVPKSRNLVLLGSLEQLYKGGRMSGAQFLLGNLLQIKPILSINSDGELGLLERVRSEKKALSKVINLFRQSYDQSKIEKVGIMHGNEPTKAMKVKDLIENEIPGLNIVIGEISSSLAVHAGEGTLGIFWTEESE